MPDFGDVVDLSKLDEPVKIGKWKIPKIAIVAAGGAIIVGGVLLSRGRTPRLGALTSSQQPSTGTSEGAASPDIAGTVETALADARQAFTDMLTGVTGSLTDQLQKALEDQAKAFNEQLVGLQKQIESQPVPEAQTVYVPTTEYVAPQADYFRDYMGAFAPAAAAPVLPPSPVPAAAISPTPVRASAGLSLPSVPRRPRAAMPYVAPPAPTKGELVTRGQRIQPPAPRKPIFGPSPYTPPRPLTTPSSRPPIFGPAPYRAPAPRPSYVPSWLKSTQFVRRH